MGNVAEERMKKREDGRERGRERIKGKNNKIE